MKDEEDTAFRAVMQAIRSEDYGDNADFLAPLIAQIEDINAEDNGTTLLIAAIHCGKWNIARALVAAKADVNHVSKNHPFAGTALKTAINKGDISGVAWLLGARAKIRDGVENSCDALAYAVYIVAKPEIITMLCKAGGDPFFFEPTIEATAVGYAVTNNSDNGSVQAMIAGGMNVNGQDKDGNTPLIRAIRAGRPVYACVLLGAGARVDILNNDHKSALDYIKLWRDDEAQKSEIEAWLHKRFRENVMDRFNAGAAGIVSPADISIQRKKIVLSGPG